MDDLQFEKAEFNDHKALGNCVMCTKVLADQYWHANGQNICPNCAANIEFTQQAPARAVLAKGALYAAGAAIGCAIAYAAILIITKYELALISIAVGWLVGKAVRQGTGGQGGRAVQYIAVAATYIAISGSLFFQIAYSLFQEGKTASLSGYFTLAIVSLGKPFFELSEGFQGILGVAILFFGLHQAWQQTRGIEITLAGPYPVQTVEQT